MLRKIYKYYDYQEMLEPSRSYFKIARGGDCNIGSCEYNFNSLDEMINKEIVTHCEAIESIDSFEVYIETEQSSIQHILYKKY